MLVGVSLLLGWSPSGGWATAVLGGLLGILMMIPLRRALIVKQHGRLKYPEGTACAEVLTADAPQTLLCAARYSGKTTALALRAIGASVE